MSWGIVAGAAASVIGGAMSAKGSRDAAKTAAAGGEREIEFQRESRDLARADQKPYREAGYTALDALMSMTGLGGGAGKQTALRPRRGAMRDGGNRRGRGRGPVRSPRYESAYALTRYAGGPTERGQMYNVHELGPENIYANGAVTRGRGPATIDGQTGYVEPNIEGRYAGGMTYGWGGPAIMQAAQSGGNGPRGTNLGFGGFQNGYNPGDAPKVANQQNWQPPPNVNPATGYPNENPGGQPGGYNFMTEPGYQFRFEEGQRALDRGAAARGGLLSGGYGRKAIRYGQGFASQEYSNVYNRIANIAGLGQTSATTSGNAALYAGQGMGNAASNAGNATAYGQIQAGNAWANAGNQIAQMPWDRFKWGGSGSSSNYPGYNPGGSQGWNDN